jgi:ElaB/YqjD/DUF883 family membrane-anchored ribosome-binding protein
MNAREMTGKLQEMTDKLQDWQKRAGERARDFSRATDGYVRENTWTTVAIAAVIGCLLGYLLSSRGED